MLSFWYHIWHLLCSGYISPEYAAEGIFSVKFDVFSFGVLLLEIVSGKRNRTFNHQNHNHNLLGHVSSKKKKKFISNHTFNLCSKTLLHPRNAGMVAMEQG